MSQIQETKQGKKTQAFMEIQCMIKVAFKEEMYSISSLDTNGLIFQKM